VNTVQIADLVVGIASVVVPVLTVLIGATVGTSLRTGAKLRRDLASDVAVLGHLPQPAAEAMRTEIARRTWLLIAYTRHPSVVLLDVLMALGVIAGMAGVTYVCLRLPNLLPEYRVTAPFVLGITVLSTLASWLELHRSWCKRASARIAYLESVLGRDEATEHAATARVTHRLSLTVAGLLGGAGVVAVGYVAGVPSTPPLTIVNVAVGLGALVTTTVAMLVALNTPLRGDLNRLGAGTA
jgi:hypothetical protein